MALSAFSQVSIPKQGSAEILSNSFPKGPSPSFFPAMLAALMRCIASSKRMLCFPTVFSIFLPPYALRKLQAQ